MDPAFVDLTGILEIVLSLIATVMTIMVVPWLKQRYNGEKFDDMKKWANVAVLAAEQMYDSTEGLKKLKYVQDFLRGHGFTMDDDHLRVLIESAVKTMKMKSTSEDD